MMRLRCRQSLPSVAMFFVGKKGGVDFSPSLQPHKETVMVFLRLIHPTDARRLGWLVHDSFLKGQSRNKRRVATNSAALGVCERFIL
jgi:hypothetical protein